MPQGTKKKKKSKLRNEMAVSIFQLKSEGQMDRRGMILEVDLSEGCCNNPSITW